MTNEITNVTPVNAVVQQVQNAEVTMDANGKYRRVAQYEQYMSFAPQTRAEQIELFNMLNDENHEKVTAMKSAINAKITLANVIFNPYKSVDEDTGEVINGVTTMLFDAETGNAFVTSSKSVYWTLQQAFKVFGYPNTQGYEPLQLQVFEYVPKGSRNKAVNVKVIG